VLNSLRPSKRLGNFHGKAMNVRCGDGAPGRVVPRAVVALHVYSGG
jgi:hypothetical protein